jgi:hypothetical protein
VFWGLASLSCVRRSCHRPAAFLTASCPPFPCSTVCLYIMEVFFLLFRCKHRVPYSMEVSRMPSAGLPARLLVGGAAWITDVV